MCPFVMAVNTEMDVADENLSEVIQIRITPSEREETERLAVAEGRSRSNMIRQLVREALEARRAKGGR